MSAQDYRINAEVRRHLVSRWVDLNQLQLGTTNGVVYIIGNLDTTVEDPRRRIHERSPLATADRVLRLAMRLEREIRLVRDVRDVVFKLNNVYKRAGRWRIVGSSDVASPAFSARRAHDRFEVRVAQGTQAWDLGSGEQGPESERAPGEDEARGEETSS